MRNTSVANLSPQVLQIFNHYVGGVYTLAQAAAYVAKVKVFPIPTHVSLDDWRVHVPMPLLERWNDLSDNERILVYVMAQSATHLHECMLGPDEPVMN